MFLLGIFSHLCPQYNHRLFKIRIKVCDSNCIICFYDDALTYSLPKCYFGEANLG